MKGFPKTIYVTRTDHEEEDTWAEYFVDTDKANVLDEEEETEVAVYQLVKVGSVQKKSKLVFE